MSRKLGLSIIVAIRLKELLFLELNYYTRGSSNFKGNARNVELFVFVNFWLDFIDFYILLYVIKGRENRPYSMLDNSMFSQLKPRVIPWR